MELDGNYRLTGDITLSGDWTPIGNGTYPFDYGDNDFPFTGMLDGGGYTISGLTVTSTDVECAGLFGYIGSGGTVKNLYVKIAPGGVNGAGDAGGVAGYNEGTIESCHVSGGPVRINSTDGVLCAGGVAGSNAKSGKISKSLNTSAVSATGGEDATAYVGGVAGINYGEISESANSGAVSSSAGDTIRVGGITGDNRSDGAVTKSANGGAVSATAVGEKTPEAGGVVGDNDGVISESYNTGTVSAGGTEPGHAGGIAGTNWESVTDSYNTGAVGTTGTDGYAGGVAGTNHSEITRAYSAGTVTGNIHGGIAGVNYSPYNPEDSDDYGTITASFFDSDVAGGLQVAGGGTNGHIDGISGGKTTAQMQTELTFTDAGWDFENVWDFDFPGYDYPLLRKAACAPPSGEEPAIDPAPDDDDDSRSSRHSGNAVPTTSANVGAGGVVSQGAITAEAAQALAGAGGTAILHTQNAQSIAPDTLRALAQAGAQAGKRVVLYADTMSGSGVQGRLYVQPALLTGLAADLQLGVYTDPAQTAATTSLFGQYFNNSIVTVSFGQQGGFGARLQVAVKADLSGLNVKTLYFYSYDRASNSYTRIQSPAYWVDLSGYLHFYTSLGGDVIITDKPLALKNAGAK